MTPFPAFPSLRRPWAARPSARVSRARESRISASLFGPGGFEGLLRLAVGLAFLLALPLAASAARNPPPNIVVVLTDDQGYGEMSCHGNPVLRTPSLDRLHRESARFVDFTVSPTCAPTRAALMTGRHEFRSGITHTIFERERLDPEAATLPQILRSAGYATGIFGKWHLGDETEYRPDRRGFEETFIHGGGGIGQTYAGSCGDAPGNGYHDPVVLHNGRFEKTRGYCTDVFFAEALAWIEATHRSGRPFFAWIAPNAPHDPFVSPGPEYEREFRALGLPDMHVAYYAMIRNIDDNLGRLLDRLAALSLDRDTVVVFMTDNGHSVPGLFNAGMRAAKGTPYQGGIRVPSFWRWPGRFEPGDRTQTAAHVDVFPTLAELARARVPRALRRRWEGRSLVPALDEPSARWPERTLFTHLGRWPSGKAAEAKYRACAVRTGRFKLVNHAELYDLAADPGETNDVATLHPEIVAKLRTRFDAWWESVLPSALRSDMTRGPSVNPFKALYWEQFGGGPDEALLRTMDPEGKFRTPPARPAPAPARRHEPAGGGP
ncbi:MAG: arylsulfatase [Verrucomicrobiales bacterium]|nr:arylsulfatase [Verrucomicrobiales bacterium]